MKKKKQLLNNCPMSELASFFECLEQNYKLNYSQYPFISSIDINNFKDKMTYLSNNRIGEDIGSGMLYDPIMELLVQSSLAHFLYIKKKNYTEGIWYEKVPNIMPFHPNYIRFLFMEELIANKASVTLGSFKLYDISPSTTSMSREKLMLKVKELLENPILIGLVSYFVNKLQVDGDTLDKIVGFVQTKTKTTRGIGLLYYIFMDLYLEYVDHFIYESINNSGLNYFNSRCLNTTIMGFTDKKTVPKLKKILQLDCVLPAWGLTAKGRTGTRGGRVLRPWGGKLYINIEGHLKWESPNSIIDI